MNKYCLYYIPKQINEKESDLLMIYFGKNLQVTDREMQGDIVLLLNNTTVIGYVLYHFSQICKMKIRGTIYKPSDVLIDLINAELDNAVLPTLDYYGKSGYVVGEILDKETAKNIYYYEVNIGENIINCESNFSLDKGAKVVVAINETYLLPARMINAYKMSNGKISGGRICSLQDLQIYNYENANEPALLEYDTPVGLDFFKTEEKTDA